MKLYFFRFFVLLFSFALLSTYTIASDCSKEQAKASVEKVCEILSSKGKAGLKDAAKFRYCGTNYVWIQDKDVKMVMHPIKPRLNGKDLTQNKDEKGKFLFVEFDKVAKKDTKGGWVSYMWAKPGAEKATSKTSYVKKCDSAGRFIAGSGVWDN
jgi:methyl-accepting chemotaxis protein